jgi:hypothetical protein
MLPRLKVFREVLGDIFGEPNQNSNPGAFVAPEILRRDVLLGQS